MLSNLAPRKFIFRGVNYLSVEHCYHTLRSGKFDTETYEKYRYAGVKISGKPIRSLGFSSRLMRKIIRESLLQNRKILKILLLTEGRRITHIQDTSRWRSLFPKILMDIREDILRKRREAVWKK